MDTRLWILAAALSTAVGAGAAIIPVNTFTPGVNEGDGLCSIEEAFWALENGNPFGGCPGGDGDADRIQLQEGTYRPDRGLNSRESVELIGAGIEKTTIETAAFVAFTFNPVFSSITVKVRDLTLRSTGGRLKTGIIFTSDQPPHNLTSTMQRVRVTGFTATGVKNINGKLTVDHCAITGNSSDDEEGGGISNLGFSPSGGGELIIKHSLIAENGSVLSGGGVFNRGKLSIENSTISNNVSDDFGGSILHRGKRFDGPGTASMSLKHVTVTESFATNGGGGVFVDPFETLDVTTSNSIFAINECIDGVTDFSGRSGSNKSGTGPNLFADDAGVEQTKGSDLRDVDPMMTQYGWHGGMFNTQGLVKGSPAIDRARNSTATTDARDFFRPVNGDGIGAADRDLGAYEYDPATQTETLPMTASTGDRHSRVTSSSYSNGKGTKYESNHAFDFVAYGVPVDQAGTYSIKVRGQKGPDRGKYQLQVFDDNSGAYVDVGSPKDLYASSTSMSESTIANFTFHWEGLKKFRFVVIGKNSRSSNYRLYLDYIKLVRQ